MKLDEKGKKNRRGGFTLVELIVVLVILGILAAIMVPALLGWMDKARNQDAILECRNVVMAAQSQVAEAYAKELITDEELNLLINQSYDLILEVAGVEGEILNQSIIVKGFSVSNLIYLKNGVRVVYKRDGSPVYKIAVESRYAENVPGYHAQATEIFNNTKEWDKSHFLKEDGETVDEKYSEYFSNKWALNNETKRLQIVYLEKYGSFPQVDKNKIKLPEGISWQNEKEELVWKPVIDQNGEVFMVADVRKTITKGQPYASIIYCNGTYYYHRVNSVSNKVNGTTVDDSKFEISSLTEENNWIEFSNS